MNLLNIILGSWFFGDNFKEFFTIATEEPINLLMMYSVCLIIGVVLAVIVALREAKRLGVAKAHIKNGLLVLIPVTVVAARIIYLIFNWNLVTGEFLGFVDKFTAALDIQDGGLNIFAGLAVAALLIALFANKHKINAFKMLDIIAPAMIIIQISALIGNFFNGQLFGVAVDPSTMSFLPQFIINKLTVDGATFHAFFLYEACWLGLGLIIILMLRRMKTRLQVGAFFGVYLVWYGIGNLVLVELFRNPEAYAFGLGFNLNLLVPIVIAITGVVYLVVKHLKSDQQSYFHACNEIRERSLQCYVFDLDQTIIKADKLVNAAYGETLSKAHGLSVYDDPQIALDGERLKRYVQFTKENHELLTEMYRGVEYTFQQIAKENNEIIIISKLPADLIAIKIHHFGLNKYVSRFINSNDIGKLGRQYNPFSVMVFSSDRKILNFSTRNGYKTAYCKFANSDTTGVVADEVLNSFADATYLV
ncbi:MAG: prolipoprotein diacylglyceryl transferase [bacterium]